MSLTKIARPLFLRRARQIDRYASDAQAIQMCVLSSIIKAGAQTEYGAENGLRSDSDYDDFSNRIPVSTYEELKGYIDRMRHGERDVLCPGQVRWYAKSSGTTNDKSKFIPVSRRGLKDTHYKGAADAVALYLRNNPQSRLFDGRALILGGSHQPNYNLPHSLVGDLSSILIENINPLANLFRIPDKATALLPDFEKKRERIAQAALKANVTNISGVPSWMMSVLTRMLEISGKGNIAEIWPNIEVFFHGGIAFTPYRTLYEQLFPTPKMHYMETYNASEGFFGLQDDPKDKAMLLMLDYGVFYEFIPLEDVGKEMPTVIPLWEVETDRNYAILITTTCGLWRYQIGDTVRFTSRNPYKFIISGRTKSFINAFGEELIVDNAERGLQHACSVTGAVVKEYTAAPVFMNAEGKCRHQWVVEFAREPEDVNAFAKILDEELQHVNSDYEAKRHKDITLQPLELIVARQGLFNDWLKSRGKLGGQHKVPRLSNSRQHIEEIIAMNK